jgi:hypothetical protein
MIFQGIARNHGKFRNGTTAIGSGQLNEFFFCHYFARLHGLIVDVVSHSDAAQENLDRRF